MIKFYLTGAQSPNGSQDNPRSSLGKYISSIEVRNGALDYLFGSISEFAKLSKESEYCMIAMKNAGSNKVGFNIKVINPVGSVTKTSLAIVKPSEDDDKNIVFEYISNRNTQPYYADFAGDNGVDIPVFKRDEVYGIWIRMELLPLASTIIPTQDLIDAYDSGTDLESIDDIVLDINYN